MDILIFLKHEDQIYHVIRVNNKYSENMTIVKIKYNYIES